MNRTWKWWVPVMLCAAVWGLGRDAAAQGERAKAAVCVKWSSTARPSGYGYNHVVEIQNTCEQPASCTVSTNVNTDAMHVDVAPKASTEVVTFRGSPSREFTAKVDCKLEAKD